MKTFLKSIQTSFSALVLFTLFFGIAYPVLMVGVGQLFFHKKANGSLFTYEDGKIVGSAWIGQNFSQPKYFHPRPSSAGNGYDASNSAASNLGPTSQKLSDALKQRVQDFRSQNNLDPNASIPADAVMGSASGLDPHISPANAKLQAARVAAARNMTTQDVIDLIATYTEHPTWGIFGQERINVLRLNLALDKRSVGES